MRRGTGQLSRSVMTSSTLMLNVFFFFTWRDIQKPYRYSSVREQYCTVHWNTQLGRMCELSTRFIDLWKPNRAFGSSSLTKPVSTILSGGGTKLAVVRTLARAPRHALPTHPTLAAIIAAVTDSFPSQPNLLINKEHPYLSQEIIREPSKSRGCSLESTCRSANCSRSSSLHMANEISYYPAW